MSLIQLLPRQFSSLLCYIKASLLSLIGNTAENEKCKLLCLSCCCWHNDPVFCESQTELQHLLVQRNFRKLLSLYRLICSYICVISELYLIYIIHSYLIDRHFSYSSHQQVIEIPRINSLNRWHEVHLPAYKLLWLFLIKWVVLAYIILSFRWVFVYSLYSSKSHRVCSDRVQVQTLSTWLGSYPSENK